MISNESSSVRMSFKSFSQTHSFSLALLMWKLLMFSVPDSSGLGFVPTASESDHRETTHHQTLSPGIRGKPGQNRNSLFPALWGRVFQTGIWMAWMGNFPFENYVWRRLSNLIFMLFLWWRWWGWIPASVGNMLTSLSIVLSRSPPSTFCLGIS